MHAYQRQDGRWKGLLGDKVGAKISFLSICNILRIYFFEIQSKVNNSSMSVKLNMLSHYGMTRVLKGLHRLKVGRIEVAWPAHGACLWENIYHLIYTFCFIYFNSAIYKTLHDGSTKYEQSRMRKGGPTAVLAVAN